MARFGPSRAELWMRFWVSVGGLALVVVAYLYRGPGEMVLNEVMLIASVFFGASAVLSGRALWLRR